MKKKLSFREYVTVASMLFGMFFGAGNLIFPVSHGPAGGQPGVDHDPGLSASPAWACPCWAWRPWASAKATACLTCPAKPGRPYGMFFTCALYLTIGPFFAIPRCATTSYTVGLEQILPEGHAKLFLLLFSVAFFAVTLFFSLRPGKILDLDRQSPEPLLPALPGHPGDRCSGLAPARPSPLSEPMGQLRHPALLDGLPGGLQHHGRPGQSGLWHHRGAGHPGPGGEGTEGRGRQHRSLRHFQLPAHGRHLSRPSPSWATQSRGLFPDRRKRRHRPGPDRPALPAAAWVCWSWPPPSPWPV